MDIDPILSMDPSSVSSACSRRLESIARMMVQINLQQSKAESAHILLRLGRPYPGTVAEQQRYLWFKDKKPQAPGGKQHSNEDVITGRLEDSAGELWLVSAYMPHDDEVESPPYLLRRALAEAKRKGAAVLIGSDANSRHTVWGSLDINARGRKFLTLR
nr:uncharacterized protein LOC106619004 [Bactrocera oleae]